VFSEHQLAERLVAVELVVAEPVDCRNIGCIADAGCFRRRPNFQ